MTNRELDALVFTKVFSCDICDEEFLPEFSTKIEEAWGIVEHMHRLGWFLYIDNMPPYTVMFGHESQPINYRHQAEDVSVCKAMCLAALKAVRVDV